MKQHCTFSCIYRLWYTVLMHTVLIFPTMWQHFQTKHLKLNDFQDHTKKEKKIIQNFFSLLLPFSTVWELSIQNSLSVCSLEFSGEYSLTYILSMLRDDHG